MTRVEAQIVRALTSGGCLTVNQIACSAQVSSDCARANVRSLARRGLAVSGTGLRRDVWSLTARGARFATTRHGRAVLDLEVR